MGIGIGNIVEVAVMQSQATLEKVNTSDIAIFSKDTPVVDNYGVSRNYINSSSVAIDFGSNSLTYKMASMIFGQSPNIRANTGTLKVIPLIQTITQIEGTQASIEGNTIDATTLTQTDYGINVNVNGTANEIIIGTIDHTSIDTITTSLNTTNVTNAGIGFNVSGNDVTSCIIMLSTIQTGSNQTIQVLATTSGTDLLSALSITGEAMGTDTQITTQYEDYKDAILRTMNDIAYFGILIQDKLLDIKQDDLSASIQTMDKLLFICSNVESDVTGIFKTIAEKKYTHTRCLYYSNLDGEGNPLIFEFASAYAGRSLCVNFSASNTALTMNLKDLTGITGDISLQQTLFDLCKTNGVDCYPVIENVLPKVISNGANMFFDAIYNDLAFELDIKVSLFNTLSSTSTKIPQTDDGVLVLVAIAQRRCQAFVDNSAIAPNEWNNVDFFGDKETFLRNIRENGFYVMADPIANQTQEDRQARKCPNLYVAYKRAGAIHTLLLQIYARD